jgi:hypothetical protein
MFANTSISYSVLTILSIGKRSFENLGRLIKKSGKTISRMLQPAEKSLDLMQQIAQKTFFKSKKIYLIVDDTLVKKIYSFLMEGSGYFFDTKIYRRVRAYRLIAALVSDGKSTIPIDFAFMFASELLDNLDQAKSKLDYIKIFYALVKRLFPDKKIILLADGLFSTKEILNWCVAENIDCEMRMHSNRTVEYKGQKLKLTAIKALIPKGRHMAKTIAIVWHGLRLFITAEKRIDKNGEQSIVFLVSTHKAKPHEHVKNYKKRWPIEKFFRTTKQYLGLQECFSTSLETQLDHIGGVFLAYALIQLDMKKRKFKTPEEAIRASKLKKYNAALNHFIALDQIFRDTSV